MRVLLCDDDHDIIYIFGACLSEHKHNVISVSCGYDALRILQSADIDVVITDYNMTRGDGGMLAHYCQERGVPCLVITGLEPETVQPYLPAGIEVVDKIKFFESLRSNAIAAHRLALPA